MKPRCEYWDNLHECLILTLPHISKDLIAYLLRYSSRKLGKKGRNVSMAGEKKGRRRTQLEANSILNLQTVSK